MTNATRSRRLTYACAASSIILLLSGCGAAANSNAGSDPRNETVALSGSLNTLEPVLANLIQNDTPTDLMYDTLVSYDSKSNLVPRLAQSWTASRDLKTFDFTLRHALFHDGSPVTAEDVVYTLNRTKALGIGVASDIANYASSTAIDATHVRITLTQPDSTFLGGMSRIYILNSKLVKEHAGSDDGQAWLATHEAGSGAYELASISPNNSVVMNRFPKYFDFQAGRPLHFVLQNSETSSTVRDMLLSGRLDVGVTMAPEDAAAFKGNSAFKVTPLEFQGQSYLAFNTQAPVLSDVRVRKAITMSYDYKGALASILKGEGKVADGILPSSTTCHAEFPEPTQNKAEAKQLLTAAGAEGKTFNLVYPAPITELKNQATLLQSNLHDVGLNLKLQAVTFAAYTAMLSSPKTTPDLALIWAGPQYPDPGAMLYSMFDSRFVGTGTNYAQYRNPKVDALLSAAIADPDATTRCDSYKQAETIIENDYAVSPLLNGLNLVVSRADIKGLAFSPIHPSDNPMTLRVK